MSAKILVVSIDCLNADLLNHASRCGEYPSLQALRSIGSSVRLRSLGLSAEGDWQTFYAGCEPAQHGHIAYDEIIPGTYRSRLTTGSRSRKPPIFETIARAGGKVLAFNPTHLGAEPWPGSTVVTCFQAHDAGHYFPLMTHPKSLAADLAARYPDDPVDANDWGHSKNADPARLLAGKRATLTRKTEVFAELLQREEWDLAYLGLDECHEMSHLFWHLHDPRHPRYSESASRQDPVPSMLADIDAALGRVFSMQRNDDISMVLTLSPIAGNYHWSHLVDVLLTRFERPSARTGRSYSVLRGFWNRLPHPVQRAFYAPRHHVREVMLGRRRRNSRAFAMPLNEVAGAVRINLMGREPHGQIRPDDYDRACAELVGNFEELRCIDTGAPLVKRILKTADLARGPWQEFMPDLIIEWNTDQPIKAVTSARTGVVERAFNDARTGHHINDGIAIWKDPSGKLALTGSVVPLASLAPALVGGYKQTCR